MKLFSTLLLSITANPAKRDKQRISRKENIDTLNEIDNDDLDEQQINELLGLDLFQGDIITDEPSTLPRQRNAIRDLSYRWPDGLLPIGVDPDVDMNVVGSLHQTIREMEARSLISFRAADETIRDWIRIRDGGCSSRIGRSGGEQTLSLGSGCNNMAIIVHEFLHALGVKHTQARPDRDDYVEIMWDNIDPNNYNNYEKASADEYTTFGSPYPYMSVMHYSSGGSEPEIVTKDPFYQNLIGTRLTLTKADNDFLNEMYSFTDEDTLAGCTCEKIEISGLTYQQHRNGVYVKDANGGLVDERFAYAHETTDKWLYYKQSDKSWWLGATRGGGTHGVRAPDFAYCPEKVEKNWQEYSGGWQETGNVTARCVDNGESDEIQRKQEASMMKKIQNFKSEASLDDATIEIDTSGYCPADRALFSWKIDDWQSFYDNEYLRQSPIFVDKEGYSWVIFVWPKGHSKAKDGNLSISYRLVPGENDSTLIFPIHGKQITISILEQGKSCSDRMTQRRSKTAEPLDNGWLNPSENGFYSEGWSDFMKLDHLFYRDWNFVNNNTIIITMDIADGTGQWLDCDMAEVEDYSRCLMKQEYNDDLNIESDGSIRGRGITRVTSIPHSQYGERCLSVNITTNTSMTFALTGEMLTGSEVGPEAGTIIPWYRERVYPTEETEYNFLVDIGFDDFYLKSQQYVTMEVENHDDGITKFIRSEMIFGRCPEKIEEPCTKTIEDSKAFCDDGDFMIELPLCALEEQGIIPSDLFMNSEECRGRVIDDHLVFDARRDNCHLEPAKNETNWYIYEATVSNSESTSIITRNAGIEIDFSCAIDTHLSVDVGINVKVDFLIVDIEQDIGAFDVEMAVYNSSDFAIPVEPEYVFKANEKVYIAFTNEDSALNVDLRKCVATPDISISPPPPEYVIIEDGRPIDPATTIISNSVEPQTKIEFDAFQLKGFTDAAISVKCEIIICEPGNCYINDQTTTN